MQDIPCASELLTWLFADDTALMLSAPNLQALQTDMNEQVAKVHSWLLANQLSVHYVDKTQYMLVNSNINTRIDESFELKMGDNIIERTKTYRYLGLLVDERFSWSHHINEICVKLSQVAGVIYKTRTLLSKQALMLVYHSLAGSKLRYGLICWSTASKYLLDKVDVAHNKIVTYMTFQKRCSSMWPLYCQLKVLPLDLLIKIEFGKTVYKHKNNMLPQAFDHYFNKPPHAYRTRFAQSSYDKLRTVTSVEESLLKFKGPNVWNSIPHEIKNSMSFKVFIKSFRNHLIGNYDPQSPAFVWDTLPMNNKNSIYYYYY